MPMAVSRIWAAIKAEFVMTVTSFFSVARISARIAQLEPDSIITVSPDATISAAALAILCFTS